MSKAKLNFIDLFSGAGGLSCGLEQAGMKCLLGVDMNKHAMETFDVNHKHANIYCGDIAKLSKAKLKELTGNQEIHAVVGGPPCQGFSTVGIGNPEDIRNNLFREFVRIVKATNPYFVVMENVTGLLAQKNQETLSAIFQLFARIGYSMDVRILSAQNYGVPEKRRRAIIIGSRINNDITFPKVTHDCQKGKKFIPAVSVGEALSDLATRAGHIHNHDIDSAKISNKLDEKRIKRIPEGCGIRYEKDEKKFLTKALKLGVNWAEIPENRFRQTKYQRLDGKLPSPTIMTHRHSYYHPTEHRYLTQREAAKIQSFPNNFIFKGPLSQQWRQIGNAVPPLLGKAIGKALLTMHKEWQQFEESENFVLKRPRKKEIDQNIANIRKTAFVYKVKQAGAQA